MSFEHLPSTWTDRPLTDPVLAADVVDLMVSHGDRRRGTLTTILCGPDDRYRATVLVDLAPDFAQLDPDELFQIALRPVVEAVETSPDTGVIVALGRPECAALAVLDDKWARAAHRVCEVAGIRLLSFYIAAKGGVRQLVLT